MKPIRPSGSALTVNVVQDLEKYIFHVSKHAMDIEGFGPSIMEKFVQLGWIRNIADIYRLDFNKISELRASVKVCGQTKRVHWKGSLIPYNDCCIAWAYIISVVAASQLIVQSVYIPDLKDWSETDFTDIYLRSGP